LKDDFGNEHRVSFKIRKEPSLVPIFSAAEVATTAAMGEEAEFERAWKSLLAPMPRIGTSSIPSLAAGVSYALNKDPYFFSDIWKGDKVPPEFEWDEDTHQFFKDVGQVTGLSPARLQAAASQITAGGGMFGDLAGAGYDWMRDGLSEEDHELAASDMILEGWGDEALHVTSEPGKFYDLFDEVDKKENAKRVAQNRRLDQLARDYYINESIDFEKINDFLSQFPREDQRRLEGRLEDFAWTQDLPRRNMWMGISSINTPEGKAKAVVRWMNDSGQETRREIQKGLIYLKNSPSSIIPESMDSQFWKTLYREMSATESD
jgi:hypothetical protein